MSGIQVFRIETLKNLDSLHAKHLSGGTRPSATTTRNGYPPILNLVDNSEFAFKKAREIAKNRPPKRGPKPHPLVDMIFAGPPPFNDDGTNDWSPERLTSWAEDIQSWVSETFPSAILSNVSLHCDETSPHVHVSFVPVVPDGSEYNFKKLRSLATKGLKAQVGKTKEGKTKPRRQHQDQASIFQDLLFEKVSKKYDLTRGEIGSKDVHNSIDRVKAAEKIAREKIVTANKTAEKTTSDSKNASQWGPFGPTYREKVAENDELKARLEQDKRSKSKLRKTIQDQKEAFAAEEKLRQAEIKQIEKDTAEIVKERASLLKQRDWQGIWQITASEYLRKTNQHWLLDKINSTASEIKGSSMGSTLARHLESLAKSYAAQIKKFLHPEFSQFREVKKNEQDGAKIPDGSIGIAD